MQYKVILPFFKIMWENMVIMIRKMQISIFNVQ